MEERSKNQQDNSQIESKSKNTINNHKRKYLQNNY